MSRDVLPTSDKVLFKGTASTKEYTLSRTSFATKSCVYSATSIPNYTKLVLNKNIFLKALPNIYSVAEGADANLTPYWSYNASTGAFTVKVSTGAKFIAQYCTSIVVVVVS